MCVYKSSYSFSLFGCVINDKMCSHLFRCILIWKMDQVCDPFKIGNTSVTIKNKIIPRQPE